MRLTRLVAAVLLSSAVAILLSEALLAVAARLTDQARGATFDPELGWRLVPGVRRKDAQWSGSRPSSTNSSGWRDAEFPAEPAAGQTRILALGDSFTFGFGVDDGERFSEILERSSRRLEVLNMGVFAYGPDQELRVFELHGRSLEPHVVVINLFLGNDLDDLRSRVVHSFPKPYYVPEGGSLRLVPPEPDRWIRVRSRSYIAEVIFRFWYGDELRTELAPELERVNALDLLLALLKRLSGEVREARSRLLIVLIHPRDASPEERSGHAGASSAIESAGHDVLDLRTAFATGTTPDGEGLYLPDGGHWSPAGHALFARVLEAELARRGWIR